MKKIPKIPMDLQIAHDITLFLHEEMQFYDCQGHKDNHGVLRIMRSKLRKWVRKSLINRGDINFKIDAGLKFWPYFL